MTLMDIRPLSVAGAFEVTPRQLHDSRGTFAEGFRADHLAGAIGHEMRVRQTNISVSRAGALRGIHYSRVPPYQAKYVTAMSGVFLDFVVDLRVGSPTFGQWESVVLDSRERRAVYLSEGLGHAFCALEDDTAAHYLCSAAYNPTGEHGINPLDPDLGLELPDGIEPLLSPKDLAAPSLAEARTTGLLPTYDACVAHVRSLGAGRP